MLFNLFTTRSFAQSIVLASLTTCIAAASPGSAKNASQRAIDLNKRQTNYADISHCPGESIGDADDCHYEPSTINDTSLFRYIQ